MDSASNGRIAPAPGVGKIAVGVFLGIMAAGIVSFVIFHFAVQVPEARAARARAAQQLFDLELHNPGDDFSAQEQALKDGDPSSPCNVLSGQSFAICATRDGYQSQREWVSIVQSKKRQ